MKILIKDNKISGTATDDYRGPDQFITAPEGFDVEQMSDYVYADGKLSLPTVSLQGQVMTDTQRRLDDFARTRNYDSILSATTYATSTIPRFAAEGQYSVALRDTTWAAMYAIMDEVNAGSRPMPTSLDEVAMLLPEPKWPSTDPTQS